MVAGVLLVVVPGLLVIGVPLTLFWIARSKHGHRETMSRDEAERVARRDIREER
ncbi:MULTISPECIES: hypothetical protein [unclassified Halorhabdus]|uniref:hypothetical protein n=1 Tax=unclassified Halorhabdus TaxID=2621901 RepID=UPI0018A6ABDD|nr:MULTISPECIES: hypothetical protein [unclassified Halorhabdus]